MPGLTAWQGLFEHGRLRAGQSVLVHGAAGIVGSMATQLAREAGAYVIGTGRADARRRSRLRRTGVRKPRQRRRGRCRQGGSGFRCPRRRHCEAVGCLIRAGGTLVTITGPTEARPSDGLTIDFVVEPNRAQLSELVQRVRDGRLRTSIGKVAALDDAVVAFNSTERVKGKTIIRARSSVSDTRQTTHAAGHAFRIDRLHEEGNAIQSYYSMWDALGR